MNKKHRVNKREWLRNILLIVIAVGTVAIFFNLDVLTKGDSVFNRTAKSKFYFRGDLKQKSFSAQEVERLMNYVKRHKKYIESGSLDTTVQDSYRKVTGKSQILFSVHLEMRDGCTISTPARRTARKDLVSGIIAKLDKDMRAYKKLIKDGKKVKSLVNTM